MVLHHLQRVGDEGEGPLPGQPASALRLHQAGADRHPSVCAGARRPGKRASSPQASRALNCDVSAYEEPPGLEP